MDVIIGQEAKKQYQRLPRREQLKIKKKIALLERDQLTGKKLGGELAGQYTLRAWPYRIIYTLEKKNRKIWVLSIAHRQGAYK